MLEVIKPVQSDFNCFCNLTVHNQDIINGRLASSRNVPNSNQTEVSLKFQDSIRQIESIRVHEWSKGSFYILLKEYFRSFIGLYDMPSETNMLEMYKIIKTLVYTHFGLPRQHKFIRKIAFKDFDRTITIESISLLIGGKEYSIDFEL